MLLEAQALWLEYHLYFWVPCGLGKKKETSTLPATHGFRIKTGTAGFDFSSSTQPDSLFRSGGGDSSATKLLVGTAEGLVNENRQNIKAALEHYKANAVDSDLSTFMPDLLTDWG